MGIFNIVMRGKVFRGLRFLLCSGLSLLAALFILLAWLLEKPGAFFRRVSWGLDVAANTIEEWNEAGE
jgi:hypothetical protein